MTPFIDGVIHHPGPFTLQMFAEMGWIYTYFDHMPFKDLEVFDQPFKVTITSDTLIRRNEAFLHYSIDNFETADSIVLNSGGNLNEFSISIPGLGSNVTMSYYFSVKDTLMKKFTWPINAPNEFFSFFIGPDNQPPEITHNPLSLVLTSSNSERISAVILDNIGLESVLVEYSINDVSQNPLVLFPDTLVENQYLGSIILPAGMQKGDLLKYRIIATDSSSNSNQTFSPANGFYEVVINEFDAVNFYSNDFNSATSDFIGSTFTINTPSGFINAAIHSPHPYTDGTDEILESNLIYILAIPIIIDNESELIFDEVVLIEPGDEGSSFGEAAFKDYVIAEGSKDNGVSWTPLISGYDSSDDSDWLESYNSLINGVNSGILGNRFMYKERLINLLDTYDVQDTVLIRFRLFSNSVANGWGWAIDNIKIQEEVVGIRDLIVIRNGLHIYPNPAYENIYLIYESEKAWTRIKVNVYNSIGKSVFEEIVNGNATSLSKEISLRNFAKGIYWVKLETEGEVKYSKIIKY